MQVAEGGLAVTMIHPDELVRRLAHGESFAIIDTRVGLREGDATMPGAVHLPGKALFQRLDEIPKGRTPLLIAELAEQEAIARKLLERGFTDVYLIEGGFEAYARAGGPTSTIP